MDKPLRQVRKINTVEKIILRDKIDVSENKKVLNIYYCIERISILDR